MRAARNKLRILWLLCATAAVLSVLFARIIGPLLGTRFGSIIERVTKGKVLDPSIFITRRMIDAGFLFALLLLLILVFFQVSKRITQRKCGWALLTLLAFAFLNIWTWAGMQTALFWAGFYTGKGTSNFTQFEFKKTLLSENKAPHQILLIGSSQTQAQLNENVLNAQLRDKAWTTELHFPGSHALDMLLVLRRLKGYPGDELVCYLSEYYFYSGDFSTTAPFFLQASDATILSSLGFRNLLSTQHFITGFLGCGIPLFRCREPISHRFLGIGFEMIPQQIYDSNLETNLDQRADASVHVFKIDHTAEAQKLAFEEFIKEAQRQNRKVTLLEGQVNPLLGQKISPEIRADLKQFLRKVAAQYPNVTLITEDSLPRQIPGDYQDLTHVTETVQERFSNWFVNYIRGRDGKVVAAK